MTGGESQFDPKGSLPGKGDLPDPAIKGRLIPLRTKAEVQASNETTNLFVVEIPNRSANRLLSVLRDVVPAEETAAYQHLRRFAKPEFLPVHLREPAGDDIESGHPSLSDEVATHSTRDAKSTTSYVLICPTSTITLSALETLLGSCNDLFEPLAPVIREIEAPVFAPTSATQAAEWSQKYWPTIYRNTNPYGPHPAMVRRAELELRSAGDADTYMSLARHTGAETANVSCSPEVGAVIVERLANNKGTRVVAVAGDARFCSVQVNATEHPIPGNAMAHATLRAIAMVAQKRRYLARLTEDALNRGEIQQPKDDYREASPFVCRPLTDRERHYIKLTDNLTNDGYLCVDLEIYLTHEPCVMCAMAILHSRFSRVVYGHSMYKSGALNAEQESLGHGLFWRDQLNWKFLVWRWESQESTSGVNGVDAKFNA